MTECINSTDEFQCQKNSFNFTEEATNFNFTKVKEFSISYRVTLFDIIMTSAYFLLGFLVLREFFEILAKGAKAYLISLENVLEILLVGFAIPFLFCYETNHAASVHLLAWTVFLVWTDFGLYLGICFYYSKSLDIQVTHIHHIVQYDGCIMRGFSGTPCEDLLYYQFENLKNQTLMSNSISRKNSDNWRIHLYVTLCCQNHSFMPVHLQSEFLCLCIRFLHSDETRSEF